MNKCLTDNQVSAFLDGDPKDRAETISHLNSCVKCHEQVATVREFIEENCELCEQVDRSYENMISENYLSFYLKYFHRKLTNFLNDLIPSKGGLSLVSDHVFSRYSAIAATAVTVALVIFIGRLGQQISPTSGIIWEAASQSVSKNKQDGEINILKEKKFDEIIKELEAEPYKKSAFELGKNIMKMEAMFDSGEKDNLPVIFQDIVSNPLINKLNVKLNNDGNDIQIEEIKDQLEEFLNNIDSHLIDYVEFGIFVESGKQNSAESYLKNNVNELGITTDDLNKYDEIIKQADKDY
jgi:hypothetical protein